MEVEFERFKPYKVKTTSCGGKYHVLWLPVMQIFRKKFNFPFCKIMDYAKMTMVWQVQNLTTKELLNTLNEVTFDVHISFFCNLVRIGVVGDNKTNHEEIVVYKVASITENAEENVKNISGICLSCLLYQTEHKLSQVQIWMLNI